MSTHERVVLAPASAVLKNAIAASHAFVLNDVSATPGGVFHSALPPAGDRAITVMTHAYRSRAGALDDAARPVIFFFNGGPGASSTPLHFEGFGPYRYVGSETGEHRFDVNPEGLLDVADLVFVDPVGTGLNGIPEAGSPHERWLTPQGDAMLNATVVRAWLERFRSLSAPVVLCGQSYGGFRVSLMTEHLDDVALCGLVLISPALNVTARIDAIGNDAVHIHTLPVMAVAAQHHGVATHAVSPLDVFHETARIARDEYASALQWGTALDAARARHMASMIGEWVGVSPAIVAERHLRLDPEWFMRELLASQGLRIGSLDVRKSGSNAPVADRPTNDPALVVGKGSGRAEGYLAQVFGIEPSRPYVGLSFEVNGRWSWHRDDDKRPAYWNAAASLASAMQRRPALNVLAACGIFDMSTPALATHHALSHGAIPRDRVRIIDLPAGHTAYDTPSNRAALAAGIRALLRTASQAVSSTGEGQAHDRH